MKLRIRGNTIRLRLTQLEVKQLTNEGSVEEVVEFGSIAELTYRIKTDSVNQIFASFDNNTITVTIPTNQAQEWANSDQTGIENGAYGLVPLHVIIEKDFQCLKMRDVDEDKDAYPNPLALDITE